MADVTPDPKPRKRVRATPDEWQALRSLCKRGSGLRCQICCEHLWQELHHVVPRSQGGDDVLENLAPLCADCHRRVTANELPALMLLRWSLTPQQRFYCVERKGTGWLEAKYPAVMTL